MMMKHRKRQADCHADVVFLPALMPLEAAVLPAQERKTYGMLNMIRYACEAGKEEYRRPQRTKIWVR